MGRIFSCSTLNLSIPSKNTRGWLQSQSETKSISKNFTVGEIYEQLGESKTVHMLYFDFWISHGGWHHQMTKAKRRLVISVYWAIICSFQNSIQGWKTHGRILDEASGGDESMSYTPTWLSHSDRFKTCHI